MSGDGQKSTTNLARLAVAFDVKLQEGGASGGSLMTAVYFRALAAQCRKAGSDCSDLFAKEEFRHLANEFSTKADELDGLRLLRSESWGAELHSQFIDR